MRNVKNLSTVSYLECSEEFIKVDSAVFISVEVVQELLGFFLCKVESVVDETPSEIINIKLSITCVVHRLEYASNSLDSTRWSIQKLGFNLIDQIFDVKLVKLLYWCGIRVVRCSNECPVVLILLELGWNICCDISLSFKGKILCFIVRSEGMARDFAFTAIVFRITDVVTCEVM